MGTDVLRSELPQARRGEDRLRTTRRSRTRLPAAWPLVVLFVGFPVWWILGLANIMFLAMAGAMALQLVHRPRLVVPRGFGFWLLFLLWVVAGFFMLWVDAPGAVPGGGGGGRLLVFTYRLLWYLAATVALVYVCNTPKKDLSDRTMWRLLGWMFVVTAMGGLLGYLAPTFEIRSLMEMLLPRGLTSNEYIHTLIHPQAAKAQTFLAYEEARPIAPFAYANSWGSNLAMFLPFFLVSWFGKSAGWRRLVAPGVLLVATIPVVYSLNRGLWACLALGAVYAVVRLALMGKIWAVQAAVVGLVLASALFVASPLNDLFQQRLDTAHSNDRRAQLLALTVESTATGSPVLGFGTTRDLQGSFFSIAGGSTSDCPACGVPPLGTQGHLWLVIFAQGLLGTLFFLAFFVRRFARHIRGQTTNELIGICILLFFAVQLVIYDTLGPPLFTVMIAVGLMHRSRATA